MKKCEHLRIIPQDTGIPLYKCTVNNAKHPCFGRIREKLKDITVTPNNECPFAYAGIDWSECPCFKEGI